MEYIRIERETFKSLARDQPVIPRTWVKIYDF